MWLSFTDCTQGTKRTKVALKTLEHYSVTSRTVARYKFSKKRTNEYGRKHDTFMISEEQEKGTNLAKMGADSQKHSLPIW